jgi:signal transduction histidine kinase
MKKVQHQKQLVSQAVEISDRIQQQFGVELHDKLCPNITATEFLISELENAKGEEFKAGIQRLREHMAFCLEEARAVSKSLDPTSTLENGLVIAIRDYIDRIPQDDHFNLYFKSNVTVCPLPDNTVLPLYRVVQESIHNAMRHSNASVVDIHFTYRNNSEYSLLISDNGKGFDVDSQKAGIGLRNIRLRADELNLKFDIVSSSKGTTLKLTKDGTNQNRNSR